MNSYTQSSCSSKWLTHQQYRQTLALQILKAVSVSMSEDLHPPSEHNIDTISKSLRLMQLGFSLHATVDARDSVFVLSAARRGEEGKLPQYISVNNVNYLCVSLHALN